MTQPEALRLITWFESLDSHDWYQWMEQADKELLRLYEVNQELVEALEYHQEQTRPIQKTIDALAKSRRTE